MYTTQQKRIQKALWKKRVNIITIRHVYHCTQYDIALPSK